VKSAIFLLDQNIYKPASFAHQLSHAQEDLHGKH